MTDQQGISVVIPIAERVEDLETLFQAYFDALGAIGRPLQFIYVLDGKFLHLMPEVRQLNAEPHSIEVVGLSRTFGESAALTLGFERARYDLIMTLPAYYQVDPASVTQLLDEIREYDMVIARRWPRRDSAINRFSNRAFHTILHGMTHLPFGDIGCGVRLVHRRVLDEINVYGDQHRFFPVLASSRGFRVIEIDLPQAVENTSLRVYRPGVYLNRLLDLMGVFFLIRFTKKPLRFFGMLGSILSSSGMLILLVAVIQKYADQIALANRPILLLGSLFLVLGIQLFALGLIGELIIFTHAGELKEYAVAETVNLHADDSDDLDSAANDSKDLRIT